MNHQQLKTWARNAAIAGGVLVPALVIAQQQINPPADGTFAANSVLRAADVEQLRDALASAVTRINALEANAISKGNTYSIQVRSGVIAPDDVGSATARCRDESDLLIECGCEGLNVTSNSLQVQLRRHESEQGSSANAASCGCSAVNVSEIATIEIAAAATCLAIP
jgi:hypothetical protein